MGHKMDGFEGENNVGGACLNSSNQPSSPKSPPSSSFSTVKEKVAVTVQANQDPILMGQ
jgi:hypothetical protein